MPDLFLISAGVMAVMALGLAQAAWIVSRKMRVGQPGRAELAILGSDTGAALSVLLTDPVLGLRGRPDYLLEHMDGHEVLVIPMEVKPTRRSQRLYDSDAAQIGAYLLASRATFGERAASFGYVEYAERSFRVELTEALERRVRDIVGGIRLGRRGDVARRTHSVRARCVRCAMRPHCDEALIQPRSSRQ